MHITFAPEKPLKNTIKFSTLCVAHNSKTDVFDNAIAIIKTQLVTSALVSDSLVLLVLGFSSLS